MAEKMKSAEAAAPLIDNGDVKKLLSLLSKVEGDRAKEFSQLIAYVDAMGRQFDRVSAELVQVRGQLAELQQSPVKKALSAAVTGLEKGVHAARERLAAVKEQIAEGAARAVEEVKHAGLAGLNKAVSFLGVKKTLNLLRGDLHNTVTDAKATIAKVEAVGEAGSDTGDPRQARKTDKAKRRLDKATGKAQKARDNLPTQRRVRLKKEFDEDAGRPRRRLRFEQEVKPEGKRNPLARGALAVGRAVDLKVHQKIHEVEHENVGVEAAHKAEFTAENLAHDTVRFAYRHHKRAPYAKMRKWEKKAAKANVNYLYQKTLQENPELARSTLSRLQQKRRIKKQYQKAAREAKRSAAAAKESAGLLGSAARAIVNFAGAHKGAVAIAVIVVLIVFFFASCTSSCSSMLAGGFSAMFVPSYKAEDSDIEQSELQWTQMETQLQEDIDNAERDHPGYDEYRYELDEIGHDPFQIIAFLSAMYDDFLYADVSAVLREVFDEVYTLEFIETVETRTYTDEDGDEHEYDWYILTTKLTTRDFEEVVRPRLETAEHGDLYDVYMDSLGGHQKYGNPLGFEWLGSVTSLYGYRENPTAAGTQIHRGLDIAAPAGTPIYSVQDGTVIQAVHGHASYGNYILIADDKGRETRYAHCSVLTAAEGQKVKTGDKIAEVGSTGNSTGNHLHIEIKENGQYLNPLYLLNYAYKEDSE